jgi:hypothetical protein
MIPLVQAVGSARCWTSVPCCRSRPSTIATARTPALPPDQRRIAPRPDLERGRDSLICVVSFSRPLPRASLLLRSAWARRSDRRCREKLCTENGYVDHALAAHPLAQVRLGIQGARSAKTRSGRDGFVGAVDSAGMPSITAGTYRRVSSGRKPSR